MAVAMETMIPHQASQVSELNEFLVPKILSVNLKKKTEDRSMNSETKNFVSQKNGDVNTRPKSTQIIENVQKNLTNIFDHDTPSEVDLEIVNPAEDEEDVIEMAPEKHQTKGNEKQSSYLLQPFLKPVAQHVEGSPSENPILKALFGGNNTTNRSVYNWITTDRTATSNCHPFKKTELSRDLVNDSTPVQIPKSLQKEKKRSPSPPPRVAKEEGISSDASDETTTSPPPVEKRGSSPKSGNKENNPDDVLKDTLSKISGAKGRLNSLSSLKKVGYVNSDKLMKLRTLVDNAIKNHKVYSMTGCYNSVRNALKARGWIEKIDSDVKRKRRQNRFEELGIYDAAFQFVQKYPTLAAMRYSIETNSGFSHNDQINYSGQGEAEIINRMLRNINEDLCWLSRPYPYYSWKDFGKFDLVNRLPKAYFSNKIGLCNSLQHIQWFFEPGVCSTQYPRTYNMSQKDEYEAFKDDFRMTACIGLLKWLTINYRSGGERAVRSVDGKVDACVIDFALKRCSEYVKYKEHEDIDLPEGATVWEYQWDHFITQYYKIINDGHLLKECKSDPSIQVYVTNSLAMLNLIKTHWPQINIDGYQNFWVVKPGGRCCGNGIVIKNNLDQILMLVNPSVTRETRYVVQKYIERPLLIYNTKFDIRQWFLVTSVYPLTVWMYKESYLRFCSQPFSLKNTHESIHLCNNAVQRRYKNSKRDRSLPDENMWDCYTFQTYLKSIGHPDAWDKYIYPGMKEGFIGALLASQETMERRKNCFELYGADFMISDTLTDGPWLIEINSNPAMDSSTSVTARMCPQVLEDIVKVVIDRRDDKNASTGAFELVFKQHCPPVPPYLGMSLSIKGQKVHRMNVGDLKPNGKKSKSPNSSGKFLHSETEDSQSDEPNEGRTEYGQQTRKTETDMFQRLQARNDIQKKGSISPVLSSEMLEGLKKEILRAQISVRMINKSKEHLLRQTGEIMKLEEMNDSVETIGISKKKISPRRVLGQKFEIDQDKTNICCHINTKAIEKKEENTGDIEIIYGNDVIEIVAPRSLSVIEGKEEEKTDVALNSKKDLPSIAEDEETLSQNLSTDDSQKTYYDISQKSENETVRDAKTEIAMNGNSCMTEVSPISGLKKTVVQITQSVDYVKRIDDNTKPSAGNSNETENTPISKKKSDEATDDKPETTNADEYIIKQEIKTDATKTLPVRKPSRKATTTTRLDYRKRWKLNKRKKVDYVQKNIEDLRVMQERSRVLCRSSRLKYLPQSRSKISPTSKLTLSADTADYETMYREELLKMLHSMDCKKFVRAICERKEKYWSSYVQEKDKTYRSTETKSGGDLFGKNSKGWKPKNFEPSKGTEFPEEKEQKKEKLEIPPICSEIASQLGLKKNSPIQNESVIDENPPRQRRSCPNFQFDNSKDVTEIISALNGESSSERSTDWRTNVETARRACHEILSKLREFNESNSKVRLQQALKKGKDMEKAVSNGIQVYRAAQGFSKSGRKHLNRSEGKSNTGFIYEIGRKKEETYLNANGFTSPKSDSGLAINRENGAVRKVDRTLPKIQQWTLLDSIGLNFRS